MSQHATLNGMEVMEESQVNKSGIDRYAFKQGPRPV